MAELSFGHNLRAKRKEVINNTLNFLPWAQGCFTACGPTGFNSLETLAPANTVNFNNAPAKMLGIALHEYGSPYQFKVQLCNLPREIRDFEVLVQVQTVSVNPTDCKLRSGSLSQLYPLSLPVLLGCDFSGIIVKAGSAVPFKVGQKIFGRQTLDRIREVHGTYAEYCVADYHEIAEMPEEASFEQAAAVPWAGLTAYAALVRVGGISYKNSTGGRRAVLILGGSGGVGTFAVQIAKHYLRCHTTVTCSSSNAEMMEKIGADEIVNYNDVNFWDKISKPILGQGKVGYNVVLDCVGGDDYWQACQPLLVEDGSYVTLVGAERYGGEEKEYSVGSAITAQMQSGIRRGLGLIGASKRYTVFTPSMTNNEDLSILASLMREGKMVPVVSKMYSMYDIIDAHEHLETHHAVGKCVIQIRKTIPEEEDEQGSQPDDDDDKEIDLANMVLDKTTMRLVPKNSAGGMDDALRQKQLQVTSKLKHKTREEDRDPPKKAVKFQTEEEELGAAGDTEGGAAGEGRGFAGKLSRKEQYRMAVLQAQTELLEQEANAKKTSRSDEADDEEQEDGGGDDESLQAIRYSGMLRKKKEDHGMFEDPYKTMCMATLDDGILTLKMIVNGEVTDSQEMYNLGDGWKLIIRDDKKDRFSLIRSSGSSSEPTQITLKAENRMEGEAWIEKLTETARWFGECIRQVNAAHEQQEEQSRPQTKKGEQCGIGMVLRQTKDGLIVIKLAPGAPAAASNQIELEDILLKVDGKAVSTAEEAAECILGDKGSEIHLLFQRVVGGKKVKFPVRLIRGKV